MHRVRNEHRLTLLMTMTLLAALAGSTEARSAGPHPLWLGRAFSPHAKCACHPLQPCSCADDYHRKPAPVVCLIPFCGPADYCRKPPPAIHPICGGPCDDYCPKPLPACLPPLSWLYLQCGPPEPCFHNK